MNLAKIFKKIPYLSLISSIAKKRKINIWLVGGFLRDVYLKKNKESFDFDFCVERDVFSIVREFARNISSKIIVLDERQGSLRVILKRKIGIYTYDFTLMRGKNFYEDLALRDFSINTLAVNLKEKDFKVIDHFGASKDLERKIIRVIKDEVLSQDPLRILRGFSFMVNYGFVIDKKTEKAMVRHKGLLKNVSGERINEELFKILSSEYSYQAVKRLSDSKIIDEVMTHIDKARGVLQGAYHHLDVWEHSLETLREFELLYRNKLAKKRDFFTYLNEELAQNRKRIQVLKLACLLHDIGKPIAKQEKDKKTIFYSHEKMGSELAEEIALALRLSFKEKDVLKKLIFWHLRPGYLADQETPSQRAIYRFFRDTQDEGAGVILLSLSDWRATRGPLTDTKKRKKHERIMLKLIENHFKERKKKPLPRIVDGYDIMKKFNLSPSPLIGKVLKKIEEEQTLARIKTKAEAYKLARTIIGKAR
jgi:poly(A) polymerase